jgi:2-hydroxycarboxylate transporter family protein
VFANSVRLTLRQTPRLRRCDTDRLGTCRLWVKLHPVEAAIVTAANRLQLTPFAQIATRIGAALAVTRAPLSVAPL